MQASGVGGSLLVGGHQLAARLGRWTLTEGGFGWDVQVEVVGRDQFWIARRPIRLVLELGELRWTWDDVNFDGDSMIHVSGPPLERVVVLGGPNG